jgi:hypothetical protein
MLRCPEFDIEIAKHHVGGLMPRISHVLAVRDREPKIPIGLDGLRYLRDAKNEAVNCR